MGHCSDPHLTKVVMERIFFYIIKLCRNILHFWPFIIYGYVHVLFNNIYSLDFVLFGFTCFREFRTDTNDSNLVTTITVCATVMRRNVYVHNYLNCINFCVFLLLFAKFAASCKYILYIYMYHHYRHFQLSSIQAFRQICIMDSLV